MERDYENEVGQAVADGFSKLAEAITPLSVLAGTDAAGGRVEPLTEAVMNKRELKKWAKRKLAKSRDELAWREQYAANHYALGALQMLCAKAGKSTDWVGDRVWQMLERNDDLRQWDVFRRIGAAYVKFLPQRVGAA